MDLIDFSIIKGMLIDILNNIKDIEMPGRLVKDDDPSVSRQGDPVLFGYRD